MLRNWRGVWLVRRVGPRFAVGMRKRCLLIGVWAWLWALGFGQVDAEFRAIGVDGAGAVDAGLEAYLKPYRAGVEAFAAEVVGYAAEPLSRSRPECGLSNLVADALRVVGEKEFEVEVDLAVTNFGGLRRDLPKGPLTMGLIMELSPFDNYMALLEVRGELVLELARNIAEGSASAISGLEVVGGPEGELVSATVGGVPVESASVYRMVSIDYLIDNWDGLFREEWIVSKVVSGNVIQRDAIVLHLSALAGNGVEIYDAGDGRVTLASSRH